MAEEILAVKCRKCGMLHDKVNAKYIILKSVEVTSHGDGRMSPKEPQLVSLKDVIVCNNACLSGLVSLAGF